MDKASASGAGDSRFESWAGQLLEYQRCVDAPTNQAADCTTTLTTTKTTRAECGSRACQIRIHTGVAQRPNRMPTARGFEPLRAEPNGFLVHHLNHSVTLSTPRMCGACILLCSSRAVLCTPCVRVPKSWKQTRSPHVSRQRCSRYRLLDLI